MLSLLYGYRKKKATINPKNHAEDDVNCFQYAIILSLYHQELNNHPERISKLKTFINNYNWKNIYIFLHKEKIGKDLKETIQILQ